MPAKKSELLIEIESLKARIASMCHENNKLREIVKHVQTNNTVALNAALKDVMELYASTGRYIGQQNRNKYPFDFKLSLVKEVMAYREKYGYRNKQRGIGYLKSLCDRYGVDKPTAMKWLRAYNMNGPLGLVGKNRKHDRDGLQVIDDNKDAIEARKLWQQTMDKQSRSTLPAYESLSKQEEAKQEKITNISQIKHEIVNMYEIKEMY